MAADGFEAKKAMKRVLEEQLKYRRTRPSGMQIFHNILIPCISTYAYCIAPAGLLTHFIGSVCFTGQENAPPSRVGAPAQPAVAASAAPEASQAVGSFEVEILGAGGWVPLEGAAGRQAMAPIRPTEAGPVANPTGVHTPHVCLHLLFYCNRCNQISSQMSSQLPCGRLQLDDVLLQSQMLKLQKEWSLPAPS